LLKLYTQTIDNLSRHWYDAWKTFLEADIWVPFYFSLYNSLQLVKLINDYVKLVYLGLIMLNLFINDYVWIFGIQTHFRSIEKMITLKLEVGLVGCSLLQYFSIWNRI
jgi:hypothetical protein